MEMAAPRKHRCGAQVEPEHQDDQRTERAVKQSEMTEVPFGAREHRRSDGFSFSGFTT
jgi:hypothetical protein